LLTVLLVIYIAHSEEGKSSSLFYLCIAEIEEKFISGKALFTQRTVKLPNLTGKVFTL
jgi:hypothetical protein